MSPDITMCKGEGCPFKEGCFRYTAKPSEYQSYFMTAPFKEDKCEMYWGDVQTDIWNQLKDIFKKKD
jgi:hypothetical protein